MNFLRLQWDLVSLSSLWGFVSNVFKVVSLSALLLPWEAAISSVFFWFVPLASFDLLLFFFGLLYRSGFCNYWSYCLIFC